MMRSIGIQTDKAFFKCPVNLQFARLRNCRPDDRFGLRELQRMNVREAFNLINQ